MCDLYSIAVVLAADLELEPIGEFRLRSSIRLPTEQSSAVGGAL